MSSDKDNLLSLFDAVLNERADEEQIRRLDALLAEDPEVVEMYVLYSQQEVDLRHTLKTDCVHAGELSVAPGAALRGPQSFDRRSRSNRLLTAWLASAATLLVAACLVYLVSNRETPLAGNVAEPAPHTANAAGPAVGEIVQQAPPASPIVTRPKDKPELGDMLFSRTPVPVAVLTAESEAVWQGPKIFLGQSLREGDAVTLVKGDIRISMGFGAEIAAKGPCALRLVARDRVQLESGEVAVHVADWAHGFTVETPAMDVIDLGTTFVVSASPDDSAEASVIKGQIRVSPRKTVGGGPRSVLVSEGESLMVESTGRRKSIETKPEDVIDFGIEQPFRPIGLHNTGYGFAVGDEDPYWRVIKGPEGKFTGPQYAMVCVPDERYMENNPESSQWVSMVKWREAAPYSTYTFQTTFDLTGFDLSTVQLFGRFLADNGVKEVRVNGQPVMLESWVDNTPGQLFSQPQFRTVNVSEGLVEGVNTIELDVWNAIMQPAEKNKNTPNPMALRVEWEGFGRPKHAEKGAAAEDITAAATALDIAADQGTEP